MTAPEFRETRELTLGYYIQVCPEIRRTSQSVCSLEVRLKIPWGMIELLIWFVYKLVNWIKEALEEKTKNTCKGCPLSMLFFFFLLSSFIPKNLSLSHTHTYTHTHIYIYTRASTRTHSESEEKLYFGPMRRSLQI